MPFAVVFLFFGGFFFLGALVIFGISCLTFLFLGPFSLSFAFAFLFATVDFGIVFSENKSPFSLFNTLQLLFFGTSITPASADFRVPPLFAGETPSCAAGFRVPPLFAGETSSCAAGFRVPPLFAVETPSCAAGFLGLPLFVVETPFRLFPF